MYCNSHHLWACSTHTWNFPGSCAPVRPEHLRHVACVHQKGDLVGLAVQRCNIIWGLHRRLLPVAGDAQSTYIRQLLTAAGSRHMVGLEITQSVLNCVGTSLDCEILTPFWPWSLTWPASSVSLSGPSSEWVHQDLLPYLISANFIFSFIICICLLHFWWHCFLFLDTTGTNTLCMGKKTVLFTVLKLIAKKIWSRETPF